MNIKFITKISEDFDLIDSVTYNFVKIDSVTPLTFTTSVLEKYFEKEIYRFQIHDNIFNGCSYIEIFLNYSDGTSKKIKYTNIYELIWSNAPAQKTLPPNPQLKINTLSPYENTQQHQDMVVDIVNGLANDVKEIETDIVRGTKNLIYFTVYGNGYYQLLKILLESIHKKTPTKNFDILFICDANMKKKLVPSGFTKHFNCNYMVVSEPEDGIEASKNKCKIFDWVGINEYNKILFLDCDIMALKNVNSIFEKNYESGYLYTIYNTTLNDDALNGMYHSVTKTSKANLEYYRQQNQIAFNCGHFLFVNSLKMQSHFANVRWFMNNFPGSYFFEQAFMVQYFCRNILTKVDVLQEDFKIIIIPNNRDMIKLHNDETVFLHFAGPPLDFNRKLEFIDNYGKAYL